MAQLIGLICGILLMIWSFYILVTNYRLKRTWIKTKGEVIGFKEDGDNIKYPIIRFYDRSYKAIEINSDIGTSPSAYLEGDYILIYYNPDNPNQTQMVNVFFEYLFPAFLFLVGAILSVLNIASIEKI